MLNDPVIRLDKVSFSYGGPLILEDVDLEVARGEFIGLVGPNGGGKSTLLKLILGLLTPGSGRVEVLGSSPAKARKRLGYVPQFADFERDFPISVRDTVLMGRMGQSRRLIGYGRKDREIADASLAQTQILDLKARPLGELSGGQLQRVLIARALACEPEILLLDEPTANIDIQVEEGIFDLLGKLNERMTILVVSHDIGFISQYVTRVACLSRSLVCHETTEVSGEVIEKLYGAHAQMIDHHTHLDPRHSKQPPGSGS